MNIRKFEDLVAHKKMEIVRRAKHGDYEIYVSEGYCSGDRDEPKPHYKTMYAISYDPENISVGEFFTTPILFPIQPKEERINETIARAHEMCGALRETGCLKS
jgi:hypothetical protein